MYVCMIFIVVCMYVCLYDFFMFSLPVKINHFLCESTVCCVTKALDGCDSISFGIEFLSVLIHKL